MTEYGIFNEEGLLEGGFYSAEEAQTKWISTYRDDDAYVAECCHDHPDQETDRCEECVGEDDE